MRLGVVLALALTLAVVVAGTKPAHRLRQHQQRLNPSAERGAVPTHDHTVVARHSAGRADESHAAYGMSLLQVYAETHLHSGSSVEHATARHYGLSVEKFRAAHTALLEQRAAVKAGEGATCSGLVPSLCPGRAGIHGGPGDWLESIAEECGEIFCSPMCMRNTWSCAVEFGDLEKEAEDPAYSKALCGQFFAEGCTEILGCCAKDEKMMDYVQDHQFQDRFPVPYLPTPSCEHDAKDSEEEGKLCGTCNGAVEVNLEALDCPYPLVDPDEDDAFLQTAALTGAEAAAAAAAEARAAEAHERDKQAVDAMSLEQLLVEVKALRKEMNLPMRALASHEVVVGGPHTTPAKSSDADSDVIADDAAPTADADAEDADDADSALVEIDGRINGGVRQRSRSLALAGASTEAASMLTAASSIGFRSGSASRSNGGEPWDAGPAKFKSLKYRCEKLKAVVEGAIGGMTAAFKAKACACMGCCSGECFFHVKERMTD